jgi:hypothetical protein
MFGATVSSVGGVFKVVLPKVLSVLGVVGIIIGAIVIMVVALVRYWDSFKAAFDPFIDAFGKLLTPMMIVFQTVWTALSPVLKGIGLVLLAVVASLLFLYVIINSLFFGLILVGIRLIYNIIATVIAFIVGLVTGNWDAVGSYLSNLWGGLWEDFKGWLSGIWDAVAEFFTNLWNKINEFIGLSLFSGGPTNGENAAEWSARQPGGSIQDMPAIFASGAYSVPHDQLAFVHEGEDIVQRNQSPYSGGGSGNNFNIANMQLQVVSSGNEHIDADRLYNEFISRMRRESERVM